MGSDNIPSQTEHIFRSKLPDIDIPTHLPLHSFLFQNSLPDHRNKTCLINGPTGQTYTYGEVELNARRVAAGLYKLGVRHRDVIMLLLPNCPEFVFAFLGASFRGVTITTANPFYTAGEIEKQVKSSKTRLIVTQSAYIEKLRGLMAGQDDQHEGVMIICTDDQVPEGCMHISVLTGANESDIPEVEIVPEEDVAVLPYSSGTTGLPKGVMLTHRGLVTSIAQHVDGENPSIYINKHDVLLCVLPMFHIFAMGVAFLNGLRRGATVLLVPKFDVVTVMDLIQRYKVSVAPFVPPVVLAIAKSPEAPKYDLTSVRIVYTGGAPMGKELEDAFRAVVTNAKLGQGYGMTEACPLAICLAFAKESSDSKSGSCGTVVRNAEMKIVDTITGESLPHNKSGEICIRGGQIMKGYLNNPEATKQTIDADGWLHTGDIGYIDDDEEIFIVDRLKELIKYKGFQVAPAELEDLLKAHSAITDAAVIPMKDEAAGEIPVAFVVRSSGSTVTIEEIKKYIAKEVVFYKRIHKVFFLEAIPKSPSGKILRKNLRADLAAGHYIEGQRHPSS